MKIPDPVRLIARFAAFRPRLVAAYFASDVVWGYAMFLVPGLMLRAILDVVARHARSGITPWTLVAALAAVQVTDAVIGPLGWYSHQRAHRTFHALAHANLLAGWLDRRLGAVAAVSPAQAVARFDSDADACSGQVVVFEQLAEACVIVGATTLLFLVSGWVALLIMLPLALVAAGVSCVFGLMQRNRHTLQQSTADLSGLIGSAFGALVTIRTLGAEGPLGARFRALTEVRRRAGVFDAVLTQLMATLSLQSYGLAVGAALLLLAARVRAGTISVGDLSLFVTYAGSVATVGGWLGGDLAGWAHYRVSAKRLTDLVGSTDSTDLARPRPVLLERDLPPPPTLPTVAEAFRELRAEGLTAAGIAGVDVRLRAGELVVVTGRVGSGKTTLLRALLGLMPLESGELFWNGEPVRDAARFLRPPRCGYLPQVPVLLTGSVLENLLLGLPADDVDIGHAVVDAAMEYDLAVLPKAIGTLVGRRGVRLSGGQVQRVAAARMLARRPQVAMVDDLSSALDVDTEAQVWEGIRRRSGMACLAVTHRRAVMRMADRILVMRSGRLEAVGALEELLERSPEMRALWLRDEARTEPLLEG